MGGEHGRQWAAVPGVEVVGVLAESREEAGRVAEAAACPAFGRDEFDALLRQTRPDIVDVCVPTPVHREYVERAAAAGKAIFVEKPLARTMEDCDAIVAGRRARRGAADGGARPALLPGVCAAAKRMVDAGGGRQTGGDPHRPPGGDAGHGWQDLVWRLGAERRRHPGHDHPRLRLAALDVRTPSTRVFAVGLYGKPEHAGKRDYALVTLRHAIREPLPM